ncbi:MAG: hypothetical protein JSW68_09580, partial [Burkholderiales bacterium]
APADAPAGADRVAVKAQLLAGGRGKAGLVRLADPAALGETVAALREALGARAPSTPILVEQAVLLEAEWYRACRVDDIAQRPVLLFSLAGGIDVESEPKAVRSYRLDALAETFPHQLVPWLREAGVTGPALGALARIAAQLARAFKAEDADLIEINPLGVRPGGRPIALDAKVSVDDNAAYRHPEWSALASAAVQESSRTALERDAEACGITFVELDGDIALLSGGAGLGMALADMLTDAGLRPANFVDATGGNDRQRIVDLVRIVFERARRDDVRAIAMYFTVSATPLKGIVEGLLAVLGRMPPPKPIVIGLAATGAATAAMSVEQARAALEARGYPCVEALDEFVAAVRAELA